MVNPLFFLYTLQTFPESIPADLCRSRRQMSKLRSGRNRVKTLGGVAQRCRGAEIEQPSFSLFARQYRESADASLTLSNFKSCFNLLSSCTAEFRKDRRKPGCYSHPPPLLYSNVSFHLCSPSVPLVCKMLRHIKVITLSSSAHNHNLWNATRSGLVQRCPLLSFSLSLAIAQMLTVTLRRWATVSVWHSGWGIKRGG